MRTWDTFVGTWVILGLGLLARLVYVWRKGEFDLRFEVALHLGFVTLCVASAALIPVFGAHGLVIPIAGIGLEGLFVRPRLARWLGRGDVPSTLPWPFVARVGQPLPTTRRRLSLAVGLFMTVACFFWAYDFQVEPVAIGLCVLNGVIFAVSLDGEDRTSPPRSLSQPQRVEPLHEGLVGYPKRTSSSDGVCSSLHNTGQPASRTLGRSPLSDARPS